MSMGIVWADAFRLKTLTHYGAWLIIMDATYNINLVN